QLTHLLDARCSVTGWRTPETTPPAVCRAGATNVLQTNPVGLHHDVVRGVAVDAERAGRHRRGGEVADVVDRGRAGRPVRVADFDLARPWPHHLPPHPLAPYLPPPGPPAS